MLCRAVACVYTVAVNRHIGKADTTGLLPSMSPSVSSQCVSEPWSAGKGWYENGEEQNWGGTQSVGLLPRPLTQVRMPPEPQLPSSLHLQLGLPRSALHQLPIILRLQSDAKNLPLASSAQIFEKSPHPAQEEEAENKRDWSPKISLAINSGAMGGREGHAGLLDQLSNEDKYISLRDDPERSVAGLTHTGVNRHEETRETQRVRESQH